MNVIRMFFDIDFIIITLLNYPISLLELTGTLSGLLCVYLTAKEKISGWIFGIINAIFFFIMFYQVRLYSDMLLQIYYFIMSIYGFWKWSCPKLKNDKKLHLKITKIEKKILILDLSIVLLATVSIGFLIKNIHLLLPLFFPNQASFPFIDSFIAVMSINAQIFMTYKKRESWLMWVTVDIVALIIYFIKGINLVGIEYIVFGIISFFGFYNWNKSIKKNQELTI